MSSRVVRGARTAPAPGLGNEKALLRVPVKEWKQSGNNSVRERHLQVTVSIPPTQNLPNMEAQLSSRVRKASRGFPRRSCFLLGPRPMKLLLIALLTRDSVCAAAETKLPGLGANILANYTEYATRLHEDLLSDYQKVVPPRSVRTSNYSAAGTDVHLQIRFFKVDSVDPASGKLRLKVWWRMSWSDLRLSWAPEQYGDVRELKFHANDITDPETTEIWLPDFTPYNSAEGLMHSFEPAVASVRSNGDVFWSRKGTLELMCRFSGLVMFPYDSLSCPMEVGGWQTSGNTQGLLPGVLGKTDNCAATPSASSEETSHSSYSEYLISRVDCKTHNFEYASYPGEIWPVIRYRVHFSRATAYYSYFSLCAQPRTTHAPYAPAQPPTHPAPAHTDCVLTTSPFACVRARALASTPPICAGCPRRP